MIPNTTIFKRFFYLFRSCASKLLTLQKRCFFWWDSDWDRLYAALIGHTCSWAWRLILEGDLLINCVDWSFCVDAASIVPLSFTWQQCLTHLFLLLFSISVRWGRAYSLSGTRHRCPDVLSRFGPLLPECAAVHDEWRQRNAPCQILHMSGELHRLVLRDLGQLQRLGWRDDGNLLGDLKRLLQLLCALGAEELVDGSLRLLEVAADHAQPRHVEDHGNGEGHQADDDEVQAEAAVVVGYTHSDGVVLAPTDGTGGDTGVASTVLEGDNSDVQDPVLLNLPLPA